MTQDVAFPDWWVNKGVCSLDGNLTCSEEFLKCWSVFRPSLVFFFFKRKQNHLNRAFASVCLGQLPLLCFPRHHFQPGHVPLAHTSHQGWDCSSCRRQTWWLAQKPTTLLAGEHFFHPRGAANCDISTLGLMVNWGRYGLCRCNAVCLVPWNTLSLRGCKNC